MVVKKIELASNEEVAWRRNVNYTSIVADILSSLPTKKARVAIGHINAVVKFYNPLEKYSEDIGYMVGITSDRKSVVHTRGRELDIFCHYYFAPINEMEELLLRESLEGTNPERKSHFERLKGQLRGLQERFSFDHKEVLDSK